MNFVNRAHIPDTKHSVPIIGDESISKCRHMCMHLLVCICKYMCIYVPMCLYIYVSICIHVDMHICIHIGVCTSTRYVDEQRKYNTRTFRMGHKTKKRAFGCDGCVFVTFPVGSWEPTRFGFQIPCSLRVPGPQGSKHYCNEYRGCLYKGVIIMFPTKYLFFQFLDLCVVIQALIMAIVEHDQQTS